MEAKIDNAEQRPPRELEAMISVEPSLSSPDSAQPLFEKVPMTATPPPLSSEPVEESEGPAKNSPFIDRGRHRPKLGTPSRGKTRHLSLPLAAGTYVAFDIETTGGNPEKNGITEIFALRYQDHKVVDTFYSMVNPGVPIPPIVRRMTGITNKMVRDAPPIKAVMPEFLKFIGDDVLVSHNTIGDMKFIRYFAELSCQHEVTNYYLCTHLLVEKLAPNAPDKSLRGLASFFKLPGDAQLHRAEADAYLTLELFKVLLKKMEDKGIGSITDAIRFQGDFESGTRLGWAIKPEVLQSLPEANGVFYLYDLSGNVTFLSSAHNLAREVKRLQKLGTLPKQLLRAVLASSELKFEVTPTAFAASLLEAQSIAKHRVRFDPANWHQRTANFIYLALEEDEFRLTTGPLVAGVVALLGPVRGGKDVTVLLDQIALALDRKPSKKGLKVEAAEAPLLIDFFRRRRLEPKFKERFLALFPRLDKNFRKLQRIRDHLNQLAIPEDLFGAEACSGVLAVAIEDRWHLYSIAVGRVQSEFNVQGDLLQGLHAHGLHLRIFKEIQKAKGGMTQEIQPLTLAEATQLNRMFWWAFFGQRHENVRIIKAEELPTL